MTCRLDGTKAIIWTNAGILLIRPLGTHFSEILIEIHVFSSEGNTFENVVCEHDNAIKWKQFPRYWPFVRGIHRSAVNSPHKGQWRGALVFPLICVWINGWVNNRKTGDLRRYRAHYDVIVMEMLPISSWPQCVKWAWLQTPGWHTESLPGDDRKLWTQFCD